MAKRAPKIAPPETRSLEDGGLSDQLEYVDVDEIQPNSYNPNRQSEADFALLLSSMKEDGFTQPVIVDRSTKEIVDGEHRWRAAQALSSQGVPGFERIPVVWVNMTNEQRRISTLRHNRARGSENYELASEMLRDLSARMDAETLLESLGMQPEELDQILADAPVPEVFVSPEVLAAREDHPDDPVALADATRSAQARIDTEKTEERWVMNAKDRDIVKIDLTFTGDESAVVKRVLGRFPAQRLLEICRYEMGLLSDAPAAALSTSEA